MIEQRRSNRHRQGFTFLEALIVIAILGALTLSIYPSLMNTLEVRSLENTAREIQTTLLQAKLQAVREKLYHRVRFDNSPGYWVYFLEREATPNVWTDVPGYTRRVVSSKFVLTVNLPNQSVVFTPLGLVDIRTYSTAQSTISVQSPKLQGGSQPSTRTINVFLGGTLQYVKST